MFIHIYRYIYILVYIVIYKLLIVASCVFFEFYCGEHSELSEQEETTTNAVVINLCHSKITTSFTKLLSFFRAINLFTINYFDLIPSGIATHLYFNWLYF